MSPIPTKSQAVENLIKATRIEALSGTTLHLGGTWWKFGNSSGVPTTEPVNAAKLWVKHLFGEEKAQVLVNTVEEQGSKATLNSVKEAYNAKVGFSPVKRDSGFISLSEEPKPKETSTPKKAKEASTLKKVKEESILEILKRMENEFNRLDKFWKK